MTLSGYLSSIPSASLLTPVPPHNSQTSFGSVARYLARAARWASICPATRACSRTTARRLALSASSPSPLLESQYLQAAQTSGAKCWLICARGNHRRPAASKYSPVLLLGLLPQTAMPIWSDPTCIGAPYRGYGCDASTEIS